MFAQGLSFGKDCILCDMMQGLIILQDKWRQGKTNCQAFQMKYKGSEE